MLGERQMVVILGLSKGGTNHLAQVVHACDGVVGFTEGISRLVHPTRRPERQIVTSEAFQAGVLKPVKPLERASIVSLNKVNYTLVVYPEAWGRFLAADGNSKTVVLLRNPLMIHRSRLAYVRRTKPQRVRWLEPQQLAREMVELFALTWRLPRATIAFHERGLIDRHKSLLDELGLSGSRDVAPNACPSCGGRLDRRRRSDDDPNEWLFCQTCRRFIGGEGDYNYIRREDDIEGYRRQEVQARNDDVMAVLRQRLGDGLVDLFCDGAHWTNEGRQAVRDALNRDADRWRAVPLNEMLYPY
ncbi:MAG: hypothetical protein JXQ75_13650 [Phycisphaerae bacterium]|nr:hypothetical protein [Phycisphaerae bacterium]